MLHNYFITSWRRLRRNPGYSLINVGGLAIGLACCLLISLWISHELGFDRYHEHADRIARLGQDAKYGSFGFRTAMTMPAAGPSFTESIPEIQNAVRMVDYGEIAVQFTPESRSSEQLILADNSIFKVFTLPVLAGNKSLLLTDPNSIVITERLARKHFGPADPVGRMVTDAEDRTFTISGVIEDIPENSHFTFDILAPITVLESLGDDLSSWEQINCYTYFLLEDSRQIPVVEQKFASFVDERFGAKLAEAEGSLCLFLEPLTDIHLFSTLQHDWDGQGDILRVYLFGAIALAILLIAGINFINLTTARATQRAREVGLRKTLGADRRRLVGQFLGETIAISVIAGAISLLLAELLLPGFESFVGMDLHPSGVSAILYGVGLLGLAMLFGAVAGTYPAFVLASFRPVATISGQSSVSRSRTLLRRGLVIAQFSVSIGLLICTTLVYQQLDYLQTKDLGFDSDQVVQLPVVPSESRELVAPLTEQLRQIPGVLKVSRCSIAPGQGRQMAGFLPEGLESEEPQLMYYVNVDEQYLTTLGIPLIAGRNFDPSRPIDHNESVIVNQTTVNRFGWAQPIGKTILTGGDEPIRLTVIGVIDDFHQTSLHRGIEPLLLYYRPDQARVVTARLSLDDLPATLSSIETTWDKLLPMKPFEHKFLDESFGRLYQEEQRLGQIVLWAAVLAVITGCIGLFGLASWSTERRAKEIGIRKVLGAAVGNVLSLVSREYFLLIFISSIIAWPAAYLIIQRWFANFAYRTEIGVQTFVVITALTGLITLASVGFQTLRAAWRNPVETLRQE